MTLSEEEAAEIKEELLKQLENFPEEKRSQIKSQVESMTTEQVENFVKQNNLTHMGSQCVFCSIVSGKNPSFKIAEDSNAIAILEINPLSKGHSLIVPKEHLSNAPEKIKPFAQSVASILQKKFNPKEIKINELKIMEHAIIEIVPIYGDEKERKQATEEELKEIQEEILKKEEAKIEPEREEENIEEEIPKIPPRIP